ncbi:MAG: PEGA domain-containing protein [Spirochaetales bacterium]|nr:PEGA domain-containing protein [Spirochaetales bacterium]
MKRGRFKGFPFLLLSGLFLILCSRLLSGSPIDENPESERIEIAIKKIEENRTVLSVNSDPDGMLVMEGNRLLGRTPIEKLKLLPGLYHLSAELEGYERESFQITLDRKTHTSIIIEGKPKTGLLSLSGFKDTDSLTINGKEQEGPNVRLRPGIHTLVLHRYGYAPFKKTIRIEPGEVLTIRPDLEQEETSIESVRFHPGSIDPSMSSREATIHVEIHSFSGENLRIVLVSSSGKRIWSDRLRLTGAKTVYTRDFSGYNRHELPDNDYRLLFLSSESNKMLCEPIDLPIHRDGSENPVFQALSLPGPYIPGGTNTLDKGLFSLSQAFWYPISTSENSRSIPFVTSLRYGVARNLSLSLSGAFAADDRGERGYGGNVSMLYRYQRSGKGCFSAAIGLSGGYLSSDSLKPVLEGTGGSLSFPLELRSGIFRFHLSPFAMILAENDHSRAAASAGLGGGISLKAGLLDSAFGASTAVKFSTPLVFHPPQLGFEVGSEIPSTPLLLRFYVNSRVDPSEKIELYAGLDIHVEIPSETTLFPEEKEKEQNRNQYQQSP